MPVRMKKAESPVEVAVVGAGHMGRIHAGKLARMESARLAGVVDSDEQRAQSLASSLRVPFLTDYRQIAPGVDAVVIAAPTEAHYVLAKHFLGLGLHVFVEKPVTARTEEARELIALAEKGKRVFQVGHLERFNPAFVAARRSVKNPLFVDAERISVFTGRSTDIDVVLDMMIHDLDLVLALMQAEVTELRAAGCPVVSTMTDVAEVWIEFDGGGAAHLRASRVAGRRKRRLTIFQKDFSFSCDLATGTMHQSRMNGSGERKSDEFRPDRMDPVQDELTEFVNAIREAREPAVSGRDGLRALLVADLVRKRIEEYIAKTTSRG